MTAQQIKTFDDVAYFIAQNAKAIAISAKSGDSKTIIDAINGIELICEHSRKVLSAQAV